MNRYPLWVYVTIAVALVLGALYTLPNFFGEAPAVQVSPARATLKVDSTVLGRVEEALRRAGIQSTGISLDLASIKVRLADTDTQLKAKDLIERTLNPDATNPSFTVALNLLPNSPRWLSAINAQPMYLGLDLRGGVHFLLQVDMRAAITKRAESLAGDIRSQLRDKNVRHAGISREGDSVVIRFRDAETRDKAGRFLSATSSTSSATASRCSCASRSCSPATGSPTRSQASTPRPRNRRSTSRSTPPARESSRNTRARTSARGWRSCSSKRAGA